MNKQKNQTKIQALVGTGYNPLLQKPISLDAVNVSYPVGFGSYIFFGPPPDFGGSYGSFVDGSGRKQIGLKSKKAFSIYDGKPTYLKGELTAQEREALLTQLDSAAEVHKCAACRAELMLSAGVEIKTDELHCPYCSSSLDGAADKLKNCIAKIEELTMKKTPVKAEADVAKKAMEVPTADDLNKAAGDVAKEALKVPAPVDLNLEIEAPKALEELEHKDALKVVTDEKIEVKTVEASAKKKLKHKRALAALELDKRKRLQKIKANAEATVKDNGLNLSVEEMKTLHNELRVMAVKDPSKFEVLKKHSTLGPVCASVESKMPNKETRIAAAKQLMVLAEENPELYEEYVKKLEFDAPEILVEKDMIVEPAVPAVDPEGVAAPEACEPAPAAEPVVAPEDAPAAEPVEDEAEKEEKEEEESEKKAEGEMSPEDEIEAMQVEYLASSIEDDKVSRVEMSLYNETAENPFWNITVNADPVGRIYLQDQQDAETIRSSFVNEAYAANFGKAIEKAGLNKMLNAANARLFAHKVDAKEVVARAEARALETARAEKAEALATLRQDFMTAIATAMVASDKNFYGHEENANVLKGEMFNQAVMAGLGTEDAINVVTQGFSKAPAYFEFIIAKATEILDMSKDARELFEKTVMASGQVDLDVQTTPAIASLVQARVDKNILKKALR